MRLTEAEKWQIHKAAGPAYGVPSPMLYANRTLMENTVERILTARSADAWDEGWNASVDSDGFPGDRNPYRALLDAAPAGGAEEDGDYVELDLLNQPARARCDGCGRVTWGDETGCGMTQPDGSKCPGLFQPLHALDAPSEVPHD